MGSSRLYELERYAISMYSTKSIESLFNFKKFFFLTLFVVQLVNILFNDFHMFRFFYKLPIFKSSKFFYRGLIIYRKHRHKTNYLNGNFWFFKYFNFLIISSFFFFYSKYHYKKRLELRKIKTKGIVRSIFRKNYKAYFYIKQNIFFREILIINLNQSIDSAVKIKFKNNYLEITKKIITRLEIFRDWYLKKLTSSQLLVFFNEWNDIIPSSKNIQQRQLVNVVYLDLINSYKGWRHLRGLPVKNQRTWSNGWNSYRTNLTLRKFKLETFKQLYNNLSSTNLNTIYLAEQVNLLWKMQWEREWNEAKRKRLVFLNKAKTALKVDLNLMANLVVNSNSSKKTISKKKKLALKKNVFTLGFEPGFTKTLLKLSASSNKNSKYQLNIEATKEKKKQEKKKQLPLKTKVKKKTGSWD